MSSSEADLEDVSGSVVLEPSASGSARLWTVMGALSHRINRYLPASLQSTLNRALYVHAGIAVVAPLFVAFVTGSILTAVAILLFTFGFGALIYGEMYRIIQNLQDATGAIGEETYDIEIAEHRADEIDDVYRRIEATAADLDERISEAEAAREEAETARREAEAAQDEAEATAERLRRRADEYSTVMRTVADGDLTRRLPTDADNEAMAEIATSFNAMLDDLEGTVQEVIAFAETVSTVTGSVEARSEAIERASSDVDDAMDEIVEGADDQRDRLGDATNQVNDISATVEEIAASATEVAETADEAAETGRDAGSAAGAAVDEIETITAAVSAMADDVTELSAHIDQVDEIVDLIDGIAEQTNTLALNASIEAARAGEAGEGFAVVADEVKGLAQETQEATKEVESLIDAMREQATTAVDGVETVESSVEQGTETIEDAMGAITTVVDKIETLNAGVQEIDAATDEQAETTQRVVGTIEETAAVSDQTASRARSVGETVGEQLGETDALTDAIGDLSTEARRLQTALEDLQVSDSATEAGGVATATDD
ncbi:hypothetical protein GBQ70_11320 [Halomicrobium sp. ZPS1]|nr:methyl-accepting chemotaxis protein [Halomicrobium mukohataei]QFR21011.1 hypothetical protein GBQ70_11320 [Halomicrobium sp. ZPS1]